MAHSQHNSFPSWHNFQHRNEILNRIGDISSRVIVKTIIKTVGRFITCEIFIFHILAQRRLIPRVHKSRTPCIEGTGKHARNRSCTFHSHENSSPILSRFFSVQNHFNNAHEYAFLWIIAPPKNKNKKFQLISWKIGILTLKNQLSNNEQQLAPREVSARLVWRVVLVIKFLWV